MVGAEVRDIPEHGRCKRQTVQEEIAELAYQDPAPPAKQNEDNLPADTM